MSANLNQAVRKIWLIFDQRSRTLSAEEEQFCERWLNDRYDTIATIGVVLAVIYHFLCLFTDKLVVTSGEALRYMFWCHVSVLAFVALWVPAAKAFKLSIRHTNIPLQILTVLGYFIVLKFYVEQAGGADERAVKAWTGYIVLCIFLLLHTAYRGRILVALAVLYWAGAWYAWSLSDFGPGILIITAFIFCGTLNFKWAYSMSYRYEALRELENRRLLREAEQEKYAQELELARRIQDSLSPPVGLVADRLQVKCLQQKHSCVGGDWIGLRKMEDGSVIVAVADATGKGMQAALVVHALQSLWAEALDHPDFSPERWLARVNLTMLRLGEKQPHSLSMGVLKIDRQEITYWSAGHIPLLIAETRGDTVHVRALSGRGNFLGMSEEFAAHPGRDRLPADGAVDMLLGTDGVFDRGSRTRPRDVLGILKRLQTEPDQALSACVTEDDRTLVWLRKVS